MVKAILGRRVGAWAVVASIFGGADTNAQDVWRVQSVQVLHGSDFEEFDRSGVDKTTATYEYTGGGEYGFQYFYVDVYRYDEKGSKDVEFFGEYYRHFKVAGSRAKPGRRLSFKNLYLTAAGLAGARSNDTEVVAGLFGATADFNIPTFDYAALSMLTYVEATSINGRRGSCDGTTYQVTPFWRNSFQVRKLRFVTQGFADFIGAKKGCAAQIIFQPQLALDIGRLLGGKDDRLLLGVEHHVWDNKFGVRGLDESTTQAMIRFRF